MLQRRSFASRPLIAAFLTGLMVACGSQHKNSGFDPIEQDPGAIPHEDTTTAGAFGLDAGGGEGGGGDGGETCAATTATPKKPAVDIIFVIDDSASMNSEMNQIKANVNTFASKIGSSGLDYQVLFIVKRATSAAQAGNVICVPPPLGGANCTDNPPIFHHINQDVASNNSLKLILSTYDSADPALAWNKYLRADAFKVFVEVSDDGDTDLDPTAFDTALLAKGAPGMFGTAQKRKYMFHAICAWDPATTPPSMTQCSTADATFGGVRYQNLALLTGGIIDSVCKTDYSSVLDNMAQGIVDRLACDLGYPTGEAADPTKVVVRLTPNGGPSKNLVQVTDASKCGSVADAWYYDDANAPTKIILCPTTCTSVAGQAGSRVDALVGCLAPAPH